MCRKCSGSEQACAHGWCFGADGAARTAAGEVFNGITAVKPEALSGLVGDSIYVKIDARAPYQRIIAVLEALRGKQVVLLTAPPSNSTKGTIVPPYGIRLTVPE